MPTSSPVENLAKYVAMLDATVSVPGVIGAGATA
jgi:hypothetical protein